MSECTNNALYPGTTCLSSTNVSDFLTANGEFTFNYYFVNAVLNPGDKNFIKYYLEDRNYFSFRTTTGVSTDIFFNDY